MNNKEIFKYLCNTYAVRINGGALLDRCSVHNDYVEFTETDSDGESTEYTFFLSQFEDHDQYPEIVCENNKYFIRVTCMEYPDETEQLEFFSITPVTELP